MANSPYKVTLRLDVMGQKYAALNTQLPSGRIVRTGDYYDDLQSLKKVVGEHERVVAEVVRANLDRQLFEINQSSNSNVRE